MIKYYNLNAVRVHCTQLIRPVFSLFFQSVFFLVVETKGHTEHPQNSMSSYCPEALNH